MSDDNRVLVYGQDQTAKTIQPLPIKFGAVQVSNVNSAQSVDALSNNLFRYNVVAQNNVTDGIVLTNNLGSGKLIQVLKVYLDMFSLNISSAVAVEVQSQAFYVSAIKTVATGNPSSSSYYSVLSNDPEAITGIDLPLESAIDRTYTMASMATFSFLQTALLPAAYGTVLTSQINNIISDVPIFLSQGQGMWLTADTFESITCDIFINATVYFKLIDV